MKKIISLVLAVLMLVSVVPLGVSASDRWDVINDNGVSGEDIVNQARTYLGVPYTNSTNHQIRTGYGSTMAFDCSGFAYRVCRDLGLTSSRANYSEGKDSNGNYYLTAHTQEQRYYGTDISYLVENINKGDCNGLKAGDLLFFTGDDVNVSHVAIYSGNGTIIHSEGWEGCVAEHPVNRYPTSNNWYFAACRLVKDKIETGDIIEFGSYLGEPITWRCVGVDENGPLMLSEKVLCFKSYDAKGNYANSYRRSNGSNNWAETTLRHWLNSYGEVDWSNRISVPSNENVYYKKGGYDKELGFLTSFSESELSCIKTVTLRTYLNSADSSLAAGGTSEYNLPYADYADFFTEDMESRGKGKWYINTTDRVFILDPEQTAMCYFNFGEEFAFNPGATEAAFENEKTGLKDRVYYNIWMRVPATQGMSYQNNGATIHTDTIHKVNSGVIANAEDVGVRPAFYLDVDKYNSLPNTPSAPTPCKHTNSVNKPQLDPNCIDIGFTAGVYCNDCETWISGHEVIAVGDHKDANKDGRCDTCMKQLSSASTPDKPEAPKKNIIQIIIDGVKTVVNNVVDFFKKLFRI